MRDLLSKHDKRQLILLEHLVKNKQIWLLLKDISEYLHVPIRTVHSDISEINIYVNPVYIKSSSYGVKIFIPPRHSERYIYKKILEESREFRIIEYIFINRTETIESLSEKLYISISTVKRMIREINQVLKKEGFTICGKPLSLMGNERKLIHFVGLYFRERYFFQDEYMTPAQTELISKLIREVTKEAGKELYYPNLKRISAWVYLSCIRLKNHRHISIINPRDRFPTQILEDKAFCDNFYKTLGVCLDADTIKQLFYAFASRYYVFNIEELNQMIQENEAQKSLYCEIKNVLSSLSAQLSIPLNQDTENKLLVDVINIVNMKNVSSGATFVLYDHREYFLSELSSNYINLRALIRTTLINNISVDLTENERNELNYILLTHWSELYYKIRFVESPIKVFLLVDSDIEHGQLIKKELETYSRYNIEVEDIVNYSPQQIYELSTDSILISNIPDIPNMPEKHLFTLCFGEFLNSRDWQEFHRMINTILSNRNSL